MSEGTRITDGERIVVGIDIGGERSDSAVVWINERLHVGVEVLSGDRAVLAIADVVRELAERYTIVEQLRPVARGADRPGA